MGITDFSLRIIKESLGVFETIEKRKVKDVWELGAQNLYLASNPKSDNRRTYAKDWFLERGIAHLAIDLSKEDGAIPIDLERGFEKTEYESIMQHQIDERGGFELMAGYPRDIVTDFGTSEHVRSFWNVWSWKNILCREGGLIISENPKSGSWPGHGFNYVTEEFYEELADLMGYSILNMKVNAAMGNKTDGWNVLCVLEKRKEKMIPEEKFNGLSFFDK